MGHASWQDQSRPYLVIEFAVATILVGIAWRLNHGKLPAWWAVLSPFWKRLGEGICLQIIALFFFWTKVKKRAMVPESVLDFKMFLFDIAMFVGGTVCWVEAFRLR